MEFDIKCESGKRREMARKFVIGEASALDPDGWSEATVDGWR
jgi:hypothetical protein